MWFLVLSYIYIYIYINVYSKQPIFGLTPEWFRELSFSRLECRVMTGYTFTPVCDHLLPLARHQIEETNDF